MRMIFGVILAIGLLLAGGAVFLVKNYVNGYKAELARQKAQSSTAIDVVDVWVAKRPLKYGEPLRQEDLILIKWPKGYEPVGAFFGADKEKLFPTGVIEPRIVLRPIEQYEPILNVKVTLPGQDAGITSRLAPGMSAFTIKVDATSGVSGFLRPGDKVDIYWTGRVGMNTDGSGANEFTKLIQNGIEIIAIDQSADTTSKDLSAVNVARTVTVSGNREQVAMLTQAQSTGRLTLSLVGNSIGEEPSTIEVNTMGMLGIEQTEQAVVEQEKVCTIKQRRGAEVVETPIPCATN